MYDTKKQRMKMCLHCGNRGLQEIEYQKEMEFGGPIWDNYGNQVGRELHELITWTLLRCPVCQNVTLLKDVRDETSQFYDMVTEDLYPQEKIKSEGMPKDVQAAFEAALKVKQIDTAICLLALRRVLETICKHEGAVGNSLEKMIQDMITEKKLPEMFDDACWVIRQLGNGAAHADRQVYSMAEVDQTIEFIKTIIDYLYVLPNKMSKLRKRIEAEKTSEKKP